MEIQSLLEWLREKHPEAFDGWDGYEAKVTARNRPTDSLLMFQLYNKDEVTKVSLHKAFLITSDEEVRVGDMEIEHEFSELLDT